MNGIKTSASRVLTPLAVEKAGDLTPLREALRRANITGPAVAQTLNIRSLVEGMDLPVILRRTAAPNAYNTLFRLFILGQCVPEAEAEHALQPMPLPALLKAGLLRADGRGIHSVGRLGPFEDLYCLSDFTRHERPGPARAANVLGVNPSAVCLANLTVRRRQETVFDMGTGCGIQSLLAAQHAASVVGSDLNSRALNFAAFNARLNGLENLEWRAGSYFEPVEGRQFDLVVSNPPYVISPETSLLYRDGGLQGDGVSEKVVKGVGPLLKEGGYASVLLNWHHATEDNWHERPWDWLAENGCDGWLIRFADEDPLAYAANWLADSHHDPRRQERLLGQWLKYYEELGIRRIAFGQLTLRRRRGQENWFRCDTLQQIPGISPCGGQIQRVFAAEDFLNGLTNEAELLEQRLAIAPEVVLDQRLAPGEAGWVVEGINFHFAKGLTFAGNMDASLLRLVTTCDGSRPLKEVIASMGQEGGQDATGVRQRCVEFAKALVRWGMLLPVRG